ncbi:hypothetical protein DVR12_25255 [Chitinophaga silvatica]|uniref:Uncharacterized protein n=1 Tax=Chitinophaga silvatica TaxID=2282649 RepID=A0A3E1Y360_9BACT|nr:hypothetical protein [Chitinophaga silvatica]RFS19118.1 hypothetical protein DVR12_25255 [Chitinophaga silvatica]
MEYKVISELLEKYWEGETSLEEEATLREFFSSSHANLPPELLEAAPLFQYLHIESEKQLSWPEEETKAPAAKVVKLSPFRHWMKYAAILLMAVGIGYTFQHRGERQATGDFAYQSDLDNPKNALEETKKALKLLAKNLNKGTNQMQKISYFNEATEMIEGKN